LNSAIIVKHYNENVYDALYKSINVVFSDELIDADILYVSNDCVTFYDLFMYNFVALMQQL